MNAAVNGRLKTEDCIRRVREEATRYLREDILEHGLTAAERFRRNEAKREFQFALRNASLGHAGAKKLLCSFIESVLVNAMHLGEADLAAWLPDAGTDVLSARDMWDILLYRSMELYGRDALLRLIGDNHFDRRKSDGSYSIEAEEIRSLFLREHPTLKFRDRLNILIQRVYEAYKGNGVVDLLLDLRIDGVSGGVSGRVCLPYEDQGRNGPFDYDSVWIFYHGISVRLSFLSFGSEQELVRICKNIYRYGNPGQLSEAKGYMVNERMDGSRVAVARPPFCESWVFFVRKFDSVTCIRTEELLTDPGAETAVGLLHYLIAGERVIGITGEQGSGKTTLLMSLIGFIPASYNLRIQELSFELHLRRQYPERNIVSFRETGNVAGQEGLDFQKKTDGTVNILGEVATAPVSNWLIQMSLVASAFTLFTHHAKTTQDLVISMRNNLLMEGGFSNERIAMEQVVEALDYDIHMKKAPNGHRYIERITEVKTGNELLHMGQDGYELLHPIRAETAAAMAEKMEDPREFLRSCYVEQK